MNYRDKIGINLAAVSARAECTVLFSRPPPGQNAGIYRITRQGFDSRRIGICSQSVANTSDYGVNLGQSRNLAVIPRSNTWPPWTFVDVGNTRPGRTRNQMRRMGDLPAVIEPI
jgi:hypothetical protein